MFDHEDFDIGSCPGHLWSSRVERAWADYSWKAIRKPISPDDNPSEMDKLNIALDLMTLGTLYADFTDLIFERQPDFELAQWASQLGIHELFLGILAERHSIVDDSIERWEEDDEGVTAVEYILAELTARLRPDVFATLCRMRGGGLQLFLSLDELRLAETIPGLGQEVEEPIDPEAARWDHVPEFVPIRWDEGITRDELLTFNSRDVLASWVHAGCPPWINWREARL